MRAGGVPGAYRICGGATRGFSRQNADVPRLQQAVHLDGWRTAFFPGQGTDQHSCPMPSLQVGAKGQARLARSCPDRGHLRRVQTTDVGTVHSPQRQPRLLFDMPGKCPACRIGWHGGHGHGRRSVSQSYSSVNMRTPILGQSEDGRFVLRLAWMNRRGTIRRREVSYSSPIRTVRPRTPSDGPMTPSSSICSINRAARL